MAEHGGVFINYRGEDTGSYGALLHSELARRFGDELVFLDSESIPGGCDFVEQLLGRLRRCRVVLVLIGPRWLAVADAAGRRRIDNPQDWVRRELVEAFSGTQRVIPILTDEAGLPAVSDLPAEISELARCQFRRLRHREASTDVARLCVDLVAADEVLAAAAHVRARPAQTVPVPAQLPADSYGFVGRGGHLAGLDAQLVGSAAEPPAARIAAVSGAAGVGKTALVVHWAHRMRDRFPDGQLYVNLRGFDPTGRTMEPAETIRGFLDALGVAADRIPKGADARAALFRSLLDGKRVLVVLDNARDVDHVRPLLPGSSSALVLITSRNQLTGLVAAESAYPVGVDVLSTAEAHELLSGRLGPGRTATEPEAVEEIIGYCARLPLALTVVAARAAQSGFSLTTLAGQLADAEQRLDSLDAGDPASQVRGVFSWSYEALSASAAGLFRLLGLHPGPDTSLVAAASLAGIPSRDARRQLAELTRASLLVEHAPDRYTFHDLLRAYATHLTTDTDSPAERQAALGRLLDHLRHGAYTADRLLDPNRDAIAIPLDPPDPGVTVERFTDAASALSWLAAEHKVLIAAAELAASNGFDTHAWQLSWALATYLERQGNWDDISFDTGRVALDAARRMAHLPAQAFAHRAMGYLCIWIGRYDDARFHFVNALNLDTRIGDTVGLARSHRFLGLLAERQGRPDQALSEARQALTLFGAAGHQRGYAQTRNDAGWYHALLGDYQQALIECQQALESFQQLDDHVGTANAWEKLGYAHHHLSHYQQATDCYRHSLQLHQTHGDHYHAATVLARLGDAHHSVDDHTAARAAWNTALIILTDLNRPDAKQIRAKLDHLSQSDPAA